MQAPVQQAGKKFGCFFFHALSLNCHFKKFDIKYHICSGMRKVVAQVQTLIGVQGLATGQSGTDYACLPCDSTYVPIWGRRLQQSLGRGRILGDKEPVTGRWRGREKWDCT